VSGAITYDVLREVQVPLLAALLIGACAAKARRAIAARSVSAGAGPSAIVPLRLRRPAAVALCAGELVVGAGLLVTAGSAAASPAALVFRVATALLFCTAVGALYVLRSRHPDAGCGCFGELSHTPVSWRVITRAVLLGVAALASVGAPPLHLPGSAWGASLTLAALAAELAALTALSPEVGQVMLRLSHTDPCELREVPVARTLAALHASSSWRRHQKYLSATVPVDIWREGCWRFVVFPGALADRRVEVVFAVYLAGRRPAVRIGMLDTEADFASSWRSPTGPLEMSKSL
jgi:hypothetical protein